jgi:hypothetical protein
MVSKLAATNDLVATLNDICSSFARNLAVPEKKMKKIFSNHA